MVRKRKDNIGLQIRKMILQNFGEYIKDIKVKLNKYSTCNIVIYSNIYRNWYIKNFKTGEIEHLGLKSRKEIEELFKNGTYNYKDYQIDWYLSKNRQIEELEEKIKKLVIENFGEYIGIYYDEFDNKPRYLIIVKVYEA